MAALMIRPSSSVTLPGLGISRIRPASSVTPPGLGTSSAIIKTRGKVIQCQIGDPSRYFRACTWYHRDKDYDSQPWDLEPAISRYICLMVTESLRLDGIVMELITSRPDDETPATLVNFYKRTHERTVQNFVAITEDVHHKKVTRQTIASFVTCLGVVVFMAYTATQTILCCATPDVERAWEEHSRKMNRLKNVLVFDIMDSCNANKMMEFTLTKAIALVRSFVTLVIVTMTSEEEHF